MKLKRLTYTAVTSLGLLMMQGATADSDLQFGGGATASASLDFRITIPQFVYFQVGSPLAAVDRIDWDLTGTQPGQSGAPIGATGGVGDGTDGIIGITLITNAATVTIASNTGGGNLTGAGGNIPFTEINVSDGGTITAPAFDGNTVIATGGPYSATDNWTYTYDDDTVYSAGQYDGTSVYTAATP